MKIALRATLNAMYSFHDIPFRLHSLNLGYIKKSSRLNLAFIPRSPREFSFFVLEVLSMQNEDARVIF